jgi:HPt (histidine-containing phosphotransfer) domain-containing protein
VVGSTLARALDESRLDELTEMGGRAVALVNRAIDNFVHRMPTTLDEIEQALAAEDWQTFRSLVHRFRGSALNLGASTVGEIALELELLEDDELSPRGAQLLGQLQAASAEAVVALQDYQARRTRASA